MANAAITYNVDFKSDYHIGSGFGIAGVVDDTLVKDAKGRLLIPGKTLKGIIRDACEDLVNAFHIPELVCNGTVANGGKMCGVNRSGNTCLLCLIFGSEAIPSHFRFQSARRRDAVGDLMGEEEMSSALQALSRIEAHNCIDRDTGTATEKLLFAYELGRKTESYEAGIFQIRPFDSSDREKETFALLVAGMRFVMRLGGNRRRGKGRCRLRIEGQVRGKYNEQYNWEDLIDHLPELANGVNR